VFGAQSCRYALAFGREWILLSLSEHAKWRIKPIFRTASVGLRHSRHLMRQHHYHTSFTRDLLTEETFVVALGFIRMRPFTQDEAGD
jgi:hypothetical protein